MDPALFRRTFDWKYLSVNSLRARTRSDSGFSDLADISFRSIESKGSAYCRQIVGIGCGVGSIVI